MWFIGYIITALTALQGWFYDAYLTVRGWVWPFYLLYLPLWYAKEYFRLLAIYFGYFGDWVDDVWQRVQAIRSSWDVYFDLKWWFEAAANAWDWVFKAWTNVYMIVNTWWSSTQLTVKAWIEDAVSGFQTLINQVNTWLAGLQSSWDSFKLKIPTIDGVIYWWRNWTGNVTAVITTWWAGALGEVQGLIDTAFLERESWWSGWQDWRDNVAEFFSDPLEFLWTRFTTWFLGPEV